MIRAAIVVLPLLTREPQAIMPLQPVRSGWTPGFWTALLASMDELYACSLEMAPASSHTPVFGRRYYRHRMRNGRQRPRQPRLLAFSG
jgi:hypothetical protein